MKKIGKMLLVATLLVLLVGVVSATETVSDDSTGTPDAIVRDDTGSIIQEYKQTINNDENIALDENPSQSTDETKNGTIQKKTTDNTKKDNTVEVHNYNELVYAVETAGKNVVDTTIVLLEGNYSNTETIKWKTMGMVLTIDGNGQTINGQEKKVFNISTGTSFILKNITITNAIGYRDDGGAILNLEGALSIFDSSFINNQAPTGGAINNEKGSLSISGCTFKDNQAYDGGAINNMGGYLTISNSTFTNNQANSGGAIFDNSQGIWTNVTSCNFISNIAKGAAAIHALGWVNLTENNFTENTVTDGNKKETINLNGYWNGIFSNNTYMSTDISLNTISLSVKDNQKSFTTEDDIVLNFTIQPTNINYYQDYSKGIKDITLYINGEKNVTVEYANYTLNALKPGYYSVYFTSCNQQSNTVKFTVALPVSEISTDKNSYDYYDGINNEITLNIVDDSGEKGNVDISVMDGDVYTKLLTYPNMKNGSTISVMAIKEALENIYDKIESSYTINVTYYSDYVTPSSTNFTLNIIKQRNTSIVYDVLNNTEGNVQINITVIDSVYKSPIKDAMIEVTGAITRNTTTGVLVDNTLKKGAYTLNVKFNETEEYAQSDVTIDLNVEIDKDKKIDELSEEVDELNDILDELLRQYNTTITVNPVSSSVGSVATFSANVIDSEGRPVTEGKVVFKVNGVTLKDENKNVLYAFVSDGTAKISYKVQSVWIKNTTTVEAVYSGSKKYITSRTTTTDALNITPGKATLKLDKAVITAKSGQKITLKALVTDSNGDMITGDKVVFKLNGKTLKDEKGNTLYAKVNNGEATLNYTIPAIYSAKTYTLTVVYGSSYYERSEANGELILTKKAVTITTDSVTTVNKKTSIKATLRDETGRLLVTSTKVAIKVNGKTVLNGVNSTNGKIDLSFTTTLRPGTYELLIISGENGIYKTGKVTGVLKV